MAAAAERRPLDAIDRASRSGNDLDRTRDAKRSVRIGRDGQRAVARGELRALLWRRLAGGGKGRGDVGAVAIGLVLRLAAAAERRARSDRRVLEQDLRVDRQRSVFAHRDGVDLRVGLIGAAVAPGDVDGAGRAIQRDIEQILRARRVRIDPGSFDIRLEHARLREHAAARMDAELAVEFDCRRLAGRSFNAHFRRLFARAPRAFRHRIALSRPLRKAITRSQSAARSRAFGSSCKSLPPDSARQRSAMLSRLWIGRNASTCGSMARIPPALAAKSP